MNAPVDRTALLESLAVQFNAAKAKEAAATQARISIEVEMIALMGVKSEGATTHDAGAFRVSLTGKLDRKIDLDSFDRIKASIPEHLWPIKPKRELDVVGAKWLEANDPATWSVVAKCITTKPAKTAVEVKPAVKE